MNKKILMLLIAAQVTIAGNLFSQNIAINERGDLPDTSAMLDISSTNKGFLAPRMTTVQQNAIPVPATGLLIYNTTTSTFNVNKGTAASPNWTPLSFGAGTVTNTLSSSANTITSVVGGVSATANAVNSAGLSLSTTNLTSTVNGVSSTALDLSPAITSKAWSLTGNGGTAVASNFIGTTNAVDFVTRTNNIERMRISSAGFVGIGTPGPTNALHVVGTNPLLLSGVQAGASTDSVLSINTTTGVVRYLSSARFTSSSPVSSGSGWGLTGNTGTSSSTNYIGTTDQNSLVFKVNNTQAGFLGNSYTMSTSLGLSASAGYGAIALGYNAVASGGNNATALGNSSQAKTQSAIAIGESSQAKGGNSPIAIGYSAIAGFENTIAIGTSATASGSSSNNETIAIGKSANANSYQGIAIGSNASTSSSNANIAIGASAATSGYLGTALGNNAKSSNQNTTAIGVNTNASGYLATAIGNGASATASNSMALGNGASEGNDNYIAIGNSSISAIRGNVNFTTYSDGRFKRNIKADVPGLDFVLKLRPVTYNWDIHKFNAHANGNENNAIHAAYNPGNDEAAILKKESITYTGFIAQEVEQAANSSNFNFSGVLKPKDNKDAYSLSYAEFVVPLVKAIQELNQKNDALTTKLNDQQQMIEQLMKEINELKQSKK